MIDDNQQQNNRLLKVIHSLINLSTFLFAVVLIQFLLLLFGVPEINFSFFKTDRPKTAAQPIAEKLDEPLHAPVFSDKVWLAPSVEKLKNDAQSQQLNYGRELVANTSIYLGPKGKLAKLGNGMNCQNCHLQAGTVPFGNNYGAVSSTYPKYRARSGTIEDVYKRIEDCFERSLNGQAPKRESNEMQAMAAYINWVGKDVPKGKKPAGSGIYELPFLDRAASPETGKTLYIGKCKSCHGETGEGQLNQEGTAYTYPPVAGKHSFNQGAGLYRLSRMAGFIKTNMPLGATYDRPQLSDAEAWDIAAYLENLPRPGKNIQKDWPKMEEKPMDHPFGPYADSFTPKQHKFGPFAPIAEAKKKLKTP